MRRNPKIFREILLFLEKNTNGYDVLSFNLGVPNTKIIISNDYSDEEIEYHLRLLEDENYLSGDPKSPSSSCTGKPQFRNWHITRLTNSGHDFLDTIRNDEVWKQTLEKISKVGGSAALSIIKTIATEIVKANLGM